MKKADLKTIDELIEIAEAEGLDVLFDEAFKFLEKLEVKNNLDCDIFYYKGFVCYNHPDSQQFRIKWAAKNFEKALEICPEHLMAKVYLCHCYFDLNKFIKSFELFNEILSNDKYIKDFIANNQTWRIVNITELVAICCLKLEWGHKFILYYLQWSQLFDKLIAKDDLYFPESLIIEIALHLKHNSKSLSKESTQFFNIITPQLIGLIVKNKLQDIYSEEIKILKDWDGQEQMLLHSVLCT